MSAARRKLAVSFAALFCLACLAQADEPAQGPVVVEDRVESGRGAEAAAEAVARELLQLQEQQGGSAADAFRPEVFRDAVERPDDDGQWIDEGPPGGWAHQFRRGDRRQQPDRR